MKAIVQNGDYFCDEINLDFPCEIHITRFGLTHVSGTPPRIRERKEDKRQDTIDFQNKDAYKVFICSNEPASSKSRELNDVIIDNAHQYDLILASHPDIIENADNAIFFPYGGTWLNKKSNSHLDSLGSFDASILDKIKEKKFGVTFLTTCLQQKVGYELRKKIWNNKDKVKIPNKFYSSNRHPTTWKFLDPHTQELIPFSDPPTLHDGHIKDDDKLYLFDHQFSIAVENTKETSYFTEKIIDCLLTKTVPIYWGAPDIDEFFDIRGMIVVENFDDFIEKINKIDETTYESMKPYIEKNYKLAQEFGKSFFSRIENIVKTEHKFHMEKEDILWSICILTVDGREDKLNRLTQILNSTIPVSYKHRIEIIVNKDNRTKTVGQKRNECLNKAKGEYVSFIDDDDVVSLTYIPKIVRKLNSGMYDGIGFWGMYYVDNNAAMLFNHANKNNGHFKNNGRQYRPLNHLNPVKTHIAKQIGYPEKNFGEDSDYCDKLLASGLIRSEYNFEEIMYHYLWSQKETLTQQV
jgi:hypothetical protein